MEEINPLDLVALLTDLPEHGLARGAVGTVLERFDTTEHHPSGWIVEFVSQDGAKYVEADITDPDQIVKLHFNRLAA